MASRSYDGTVFQNFATSIESQELMDDLTSDPDHQALLKNFYYREENRSPSPIERVLQKSVLEIIQNEIDSKFTPSRWYQTRFSDGTWPVLYSAESEETALKEALFHMREFYLEELKKREIPVQRRVARLHIQSDHCFDLVSDKDFDHAKLISKDRSGYPYCQGLAKDLRSKGIQILRAPSARDNEGVNIPIFEKSVIQKDEGHLKYLQCLLKLDGTAEVRGLLVEEMKIYTS